MRDHVGMRTIALAIATVLALTACGVDSVEPTVPTKDAPPEEQCVGTFTWHYGSTPPPTSDNWTLTLHGDGTADYVHEASHVDEVVYEDKGFEVDDVETIPALCEAAAEVPQDEKPRLGTAYASWDLTAPERGDHQEPGDTTQPDDFAPVLEAARAIVGEERLGKGEAAFEQWQSTYAG